ncbi:MAG: integrase core domain-containing protein [Xanthomonadaceae bacterium]|jgi:transposase InsO family protein|nr:integrase core domain-containing protein [Xanthomonadaceae bacterium]
MGWGRLYDSAMAESFFASLECELLNRRRFVNRTPQARLPVLIWIEAWYSPRRRHSALGYRAPDNKRPINPSLLSPMAGFYLFTKTGESPAQGIFSATGHRKCDGPVLPINNCPPD